MGFRGRTFSIALFSLLGCASAERHPDALARPESIDNETETTSLAREKSSPLKTIWQLGRKGRIVFTVHGIRGAPADLDPIHAKVAARSREISTFLYADEGVDLDEASEVLGQEIVERLGQSPGSPPVEIYAHSMGARLAVSALMRQAEALKGYSIRLTLIAPMLGGSEQAVGAQSAFWPLNVVPAVQLAQDMDPAGDFQRALENFRPSPKLRAAILRGGQDEIVPLNRAYRQVVRALNAPERVLPGADHVSIIEQSLPHLGL